MTATETPAHANPAIEVPSSQPSSRWESLGSGLPDQRAVRVSKSRDGARRAEVAIAGLNAAREARLVVPRAERGDAKGLSVAPLLTNQISISRRRSAQADVGGSG